MNSLILVEMYFTMYYPIKGGIMKHRPPTKRHTERLCFTTKIDVQKNSTKPILFIGNVKKQLSSGPNF